MSRILVYETKSVLKELRNYRDQVSKRYENLRQYDDSSLSASVNKKKSKVYFYRTSKDTDGKEYLGGASHPAVKSIREAKYSKELLRVLDHDIKILETVDKEFVIPDYKVISRRIPKVYRCPTNQAVLPSSPEAAEWKARMEAEKAKYEVYRPEDLIHRAADGTLMRSLSEVLIANYLISHGITFVYEKPIFHHGRRLNPDFTILSPIDNKTVIIIEHQGAMESETYQRKYIKSLLFYLHTNLVPNKDVFFTFNHLNRNLDLRQIDSILHIAFGFSPRASA